MQYPRLVVILVVVLLVSKGPSGVQTLVPDYCVQRVGCFHDLADRDLEVQLVHGDTSPLSCRDGCKSQYMYAGTENGEECWCDDDFGKHKHMPGLCDSGKSCQGSPEYRCGNEGGIDVFMTGKTRQIAHLGCFNDDLAHTLSTGGVNVDPLQCAASCRNLGYIFSGLQSGTTCLCGNTYGAAGTASSCDVPCLTQGATNCGGTNVNSVYFTGKDDFWQTLSVAHDTYDHLPVHLLLDDSETTCVGVDGGSTADFTIKFSTTAYYQTMTPGITMLVTMENSACETAGKPHVLVYVDNGAATSGFHGQFSKCQLFETLPDGILNTCVFKCMCINASCKEIFVRFRKSQLAVNTRVCEIRSCYSI